MGSSGLKAIGGNRLSRMKLDRFDSTESASNRTTLPAAGEGDGVGVVVRRCLAGSGRYVGAQECLRRFWEAVEPQGSDHFIPNFGIEAIF